MEVCILLAAAGSSYLARRWHKKEDHQELKCLLNHNSQINNINNSNNNNNNNNNNDDDNGPEFRREKYRRFLSPSPSWKQAPSCPRRLFTSRPCHRNPVAPELQYLLAPAETPDAEIGSARTECRNGVENGSAQRTALGLPPFPARFNIPPSLCANTSESSSFLPRGWFNFGLGIGIMFGMNSHKNEANMLIETLREMEISLQKLEQQLEVSETETFGYGTRDAQIHGDALLKATSLSQSLRRIVCSLTEREYLRDMPKLEVALEAELERMKLNLHPLKVSEGNSFCDMHKADATNNFAEGESGVESEAEFESESESSHHSSEEEENYMPNYAVSPRDLERHLYQVLESRLKERVAELEAELNYMASESQIKEEELLWWRGQGMKSRTARISSFNTYSSSEECSVVKGDMIKESVEEGFLFGSSRDTLSYSESEQVFKVQDLPEDIANGNSGSTPCSIKLIDNSIAKAVKPHDRIISPFDINSFTPPVVGYSVDILEQNVSGHHSPSQNEACHFEGSTTASVTSQCFEGADASVGNFGTNCVYDESGDVSESNEQMGKLLIKHIIEKTSEHSPIAQEF